MDADDSGVDEFSTPLSEFGLVKMKSMTDLLDMDYNSPLQHVTKGHPNGSGSRIKPGKSMNNLYGERSFGDTPVDLLKLKRDFETIRFDHARQQSYTNILKDIYDDSMSQDFHENPEAVVLRFGCRTPNLEATRNSFDTAGPHRKKFGVGDTKYIGNDSFEETGYSLTKMKSLGTIPDMEKARKLQEVLVRKTINKSKLTAVNLEQRFEGEDDDVFYNDENKVNFRPKSSSGYERRLLEVNGRKSQPPLNELSNRRKEEFKIPQNPSRHLRKEKSSSHIEVMRGRPPSIHQEKYRYE